jgi:hypothetical protein
VLPTYNFGLRKERSFASPRDFRIGTATISFDDSSDGVVWSVRYDNVASGEELSLEYRTRSGLLADLTDTWRISATNTAGDRFSQFAAIGLLEDSPDGRTIVTTVNGTPLVYGTVDPVPVLCNWSMLARFPVPEDERRREGFVILEDLEKPRHHCRIDALSDGEIEIHGRPLRGYAVQGQGIVPTYWWVGSGGYARIAITTWRVYVLSGWAFREDR